MTPSAASGNAFLSPQSLETITEYAAREFGLSFYGERARELLRGLQAAASEHHFESAEKFIEWYVSTRTTAERIELLASHLTNGETYFFRESSALDAVARLLKSCSILDHIRIWSAGCSTGEEAYSLAITAHNVIQERGGPNVSILATDVNPHALHVAEQAIYRPWSFRGTPEWVMASYCIQKSDGTRQVRPDIRSMVKFRSLNLALAPYPSAVTYTTNIDIIFCRNVLMYFIEPIRNAVLKRFSLCLTNRGFLALSSSEGNIAASTGFFQQKPLGKTIVYVKPGASHQAETTNEKPTVEFSLPIPPSQHTHEDKFPRREPPEAIQPQVQVRQFNSLILQARSAFDAKNYEKARRIIEEQVLPHTELNGQDSGLLARIYANMGDLELAEKWGEQAVTLEKLSPYLRYLLASIQIERNTLKQAKTNLKKAIYIDSDFILAFFGLGNLYRHEKKTEKAKKAYATARRLLSKLDPEALVPCGEGLRVGGLIEMIDTIPQ